MASVADIFKTMEYGPAPEAGKPGVEWIEAHQPFGLYIGGEWRKPSGGDYFDSTNPASGKVIARIAKGTSADVDAAVAAAGAAFETWGKTPGHVRARYLYAIARHIQKHSRLLGRAREHGQRQDRSARPATSTSRWWPGTSTTTPAGRS